MIALPGRQLGVGPDLPLVLVARIGGLERVIVGADLQHDVDQVLELDVVRARPHVDAVAGVMPDALGRQVAQDVVQHLDIVVRPAPHVLDAHVGLEHVVHGEMRIVDLQHEARIDDRLVFLAQRFADGDQELVGRSCSAG